MEAHYVPATDRTTEPYTVYYNGGSAAVNVNQAAGTGGVWTSLGTRSFLAGTGHKVVLKDSTDTTKAAIADAVRFTKTATDTKKAARWTAPGRVPTTSAPPRPRPPTTTTSACPTI